MFCLTQFIESAADDIFRKLKRENYYAELNEKDKIFKLAELFADINALHPFREGNGRCQREFIQFLAKVIGLNLNISNVDADTMIVASYESVNGYNDKIIDLFMHSYEVLSKEETEKNIHLLVKNKGIQSLLLSSLK